MAAYVISEVDVIDKDLADIYRTRAAASIAEYGGDTLCAAQRPG